MTNSHVSAITLVLLSLSGCGGRLGYRWSYRNAEDTGLYGGPYVTLAASTAKKLDPVGSQPYAQVQGDYNFSAGDDFATLGGGFAYAPSADRRHWATGLMVAFEPWHGLGVHVSLCSGWGDWGEARGCARWSSKGYVGLDVGGGLNPTRIGANMHEYARLHPDSGSSTHVDWD